MMYVHRVGWLSNSGASGKTYCLFAVWGDAMLPFPLRYPLLVEWSNHCLLPSSYFCWCSTGKDRPNNAVWSNDSTGTLEIQSQDHRRDQGKGGKTSFSSSTARAKKGKCRICFSSFVALFWNGENGGVILAMAHLRCVLVYTMEYELSSNCADIQCRTRSNTTSICGD